MRTLVILGIFIVNIHSLSAQKLVPTNFLFRSLAVGNTDSTVNNMRSNVITEIILKEDLQTNSTSVWLGTGLGVSVIIDSDTVEAIPDTAGLANSLSSSSTETTTNRLPQGGISAMAAGSDGTLFIAFAGSENDIPVGKGFAFTANASAFNATDSTINWTYFNQQIENSDKPYFEFWQFKSEALPITVPHQNVTYDIALSHQDEDTSYAFTASWAGGLRRLKFKNERNANGDVIGLIPIKWERVPLPMDDQFELKTCELTSYDTVPDPYDPPNEMLIIKDYYFNPRDPIDGGNHNHKVFSILTYGDTIWVGTANGINRGIFGGYSQLFGYCIDWQHYSYPAYGLSGNFVVGLALQRHKGKRVIWAATVNADDPTEQRGVSYTTNDGLSWNTALLGERVYNITAHDSLVFAATAKGLWKTEDGINWARYNPARQAIPVPNTAIHSTDEVLANEVYSVAFDSRDSSIWIGTGDGAAHSYDLDGLNWKIFRAEYDRDEVYAYPNPFSPYTHNVIGGDGYVRFHTNEWSGTFVIDLDVYNFAMEKVFAGSFDRRDASSGALKWNGRDTQGRFVDNGVYFVKLKYPENQTSKPSAHWVKLIVVK